MQLRIFIEPQLGATYEDQLAMARATEDAGFDGFFRSEHYLAPGEGGLPGPTDSWVTLGAIARETERIRLGTLVSSVTFRLPGPLAVAVAQVDAMSGGRVELGLGTGWLDREHDAYGVPFGSFATRFEMLEEQLQIVTGMWAAPAGERFSFSGKHYRLADCPALPKPAQTPHPPLIVGGVGSRRTPQLAARYADEFNAPFLSVSEAAAAFDRVREACAAIDRPVPVLSQTLTVVCGRDDAEVARRASAVQVEASGAEDRRAVGTPGKVVDLIGRFAEVGATRFYLQLLDVRDLDQVGVLAERVAPQLA